MAVAVKKSGFRNIKIYNGGLKDWKKSGYEIEVIEPLPEYEDKFILADTLLAKIKQSDLSNCLDQNNQTVLTILDFRNEYFLKTDSPFPSIKTKCKTIHCLLDDLIEPEVRSLIPDKGLVVLVCETGNRSWAAMRYLYKWGYTNIVGLQFGMRGWIKSDYPVDMRK